MASLPFSLIGVFLVLDRHDAQHLFDHRFIG
jgi:hypothetical protein